MIKVQEGLFAVEEQMPCFPNDIIVHHYIMPDTLDRVEQEEAAARILSFSQELNQWVGVSWNKLAEIIKKDHDRFTAINNTEYYNYRKQWHFQRKLRSYYILCIFTLGIYKLFVKKPLLQIREIPFAPLPHSGIYSFGYQYVLVGIRELISKEMLKHHPYENGRIETDDIFFPTSLLVSRIMQRQSERALLIKR